MIQHLRIRLARWILGEHCACYRMGYHDMVDFEQHCARDQALQQARKNEHS